ncbi:MAG TPA: LysR family transcriptional regulator [Burkholderiales bacterium]|nr:LysR family transcriptional regulator [Burkholderiales bacterium]
MRYRLNDIEAFVLVLETGSISAAALRLGLAKSVVSKRITGLEAGLGAQLLHRSTRGTTPTDRGEEFYRRAREFMHQLDGAVEAMAESDEQLTGQIRIAAPMSFGTMYLGPMLFDFTNRHPKLELSIELDDRKIDMEAAGFDLAIRIVQLKDSTLIARKLAVSRRVACCSPAYAKKNGLPKSLDDLANHHCIGYTFVPSGQLWQFEGKRSSEEMRSVVVHSQLVLNNGEAMRDAASAGMGICLIPSFIAADALKEGRLINALPDETPTADTIYAIYPRLRQQSAKVRVIVEHLSKCLAGTPPWEKTTAI